jgi:hypothetical protein
MNKQKKLDNYFNAAKNSGEDFSQSELQRVVESSSDDSKGGIDFTSTNNSKRIVFMITIGLTLISGIVGTMFWFNSPLEPSPNKIRQTTTSSERKSIKQQVQIAPATKKTVSIPQAPIAKNSEANTKSIAPNKAKTLNIDGLTTITLSKEELVKLGVTPVDSYPNCGISIDNGDVTINYYKLNTPPINTNLQSNSQSTEIQGSAFVPDSNKIYTFELSHLQQRVAQIISDDNEIFTSTTIRENSKKAVKKDLPLLITSLKGKIIRDGVELSDSIKKKSQAERDVEWLNTHNPKNKQTMLLYLFPDDTLMTQENINSILNDTNSLVVFRRFTPDDVEQMKKDEETRTNKINEYLRLNKLIAIKVESDCPNNTVIFWYKPTEDFIKSLPERYWVGLYKEMLPLSITYSTITSIVPKDQDTKEQNAKTGCEYSDICRATSGSVVETTVYPNPANESITLKFVLNEERKCTFSLHDLNGIYMQELGSESTFRKGEHSTTMDIHTVKAGVYLLSMLTDKGERIVQRVIVKK